MTKRRQERLADLLKEEISSILFQKIHDPRLRLCSITDVILSPDYRHARVYVSILGDEKHREECIRVLTAASGVFRRELGKLNLRAVPSLDFYHDAGAEYQQHIEELLSSVRKPEGEE